MIYFVIIIHDTRWIVIKFPHAMIQTYWHKEPEFKKKNYHVDEIVDDG